MQLRNKREFSKPEVVIIPMIDIIFFLLVFFMLTTLHMVNLKTIDIALPHAAKAQTNLSAQSIITLTKDDKLYLDDKPINREKLLQDIYVAHNNDNNFSLVIRVEKDTNYNLVMKLLDDCKSVGIDKIGLAATKGEK